LIICLGITMTANAQSKKGQKKDFKILFIGNSYTAGIKKYFTGLAKEGKPETKIDWVTPGGRQLRKHAENRNLIEQIEKGNYDVVVLQDQSQTPSFQNYIKDHLPAIKKLNDAISNSKAKTVLYMTWGRKIGDKHNEKLFPKDNYEKMQKRLTAGYEKLGKELDAEVSPVGLAWGKLVNDIELYAKDGSHPNKNGGYLASCVLYYNIFGSSPEKLSYKGDVNINVAEKIRKVAAQTVKEYKK
jgi:hypothetical protein